MNFEKNNGEKVKSKSHCAQNPVESALDIGSLCMDCNPRFVGRLFSAPALKGAVGYAQPSCRLPARQFAPLPCRFDGIVVFAVILEVRPKVDASRFRRSDSLGLPLTVEFPLCLGHIAQQLQDDVGNEDTCQIPPLACIQQRHIQHHDGGLLVFCDKPPLLPALRGKVYCFIRKPQMHFSDSNQKR